MDSDCSLFRHILQFEDEDVTTRQVLSEHVIPSKAWIKKLFKKWVASSYVDDVVLNSNLSVSEGTASEAAGLDASVAHWRHSMVGMPVCGGFDLVVPEQLANRIGLQHFVPAVTARLISVHLIAEVREMIRVQRHRLTISVMDKYALVQG